MHTSIEGVYRDGKIELLEPAPSNAEGRVIVTFLANPKPFGRDVEGETPVRYEGGVLVYDGQLLGSVESMIDELRKERIRQFFPGCSG